MFFFVICLPFPCPYSSFWFCLPVARNYMLHSLSSVVSLLLSNIRALPYFNLVPPLPVCCFPTGLVMSQIRHCCCFPRLLCIQLCPPPVVPHPISCPTPASGSLFFSFTCSPMCRGPCGSRVTPWTSSHDVSQNKMQRTTEEDSSPGACLESHSTWHPLAGCDYHHSPGVQPGEPQAFLDLAAQ